jgi:hypothetical protein
MPVRVEEMTSEVVAAMGDLPLTEAQIEKLLQIIMRQLAERERAEGHSREATALRRRVAPGAPIQR